MKIGVVGSMQKTEKMLEIQAELEKHGHKTFISSFAPSFVGKTDKEKEKIKLKQKYTKNAIREFWKKMQGADAILVVNVDKDGINNYIGGNTLMEIGFAHVMGQKIFLLNPIPDISFYKTEIKALKPVVINGNLKRIK